MAGIPKVSVVDKVSYDFFSKMAKENNCKFHQIRINDDMTGNFLMNDTAFDCFLTSGDKVVGMQGFNAPDPVNYVKNLCKRVIKLPCSNETKIKVFEELTKV